MCGIAGIVSRADPQAGEAVVSMTRALVHRGPDDVGFWRLAGGCATPCAADDLAQPADTVFGHRRLSIVDLEGGEQPMENESGSICVAFNGDIYNHPEVRAELERLGHRYRTHCDTETLIHGWEEWGESLFGRLNGIYAFAIADTDVERSYSSVIRLA
jgi:asparagine synthase (glutamine-hydrolysing)